MPIILIVDDDRELVNLVFDYLKAEGFGVASAYDGQKAIELVATEKPDLVILDIMLPTVDGLEVCRSIRKNYATPVIMLSARGEELDKIIGLEAGADDYLSKPFSPRELVARVKAQLRRSHLLEAEASNFEWDDFRLDLLGYRLFKGSEEVQLTAKEYELLGYLVRYPHQVFSREHLYLQLWGDDSLGDTSTVMVHIRRLREKIEPYPSNPIYIKTVWGAGYKFTGDRKQAPNENKG